MPIQIYTFVVKFKIILQHPVEHNIEHRLTLPAHPQTNGMVERVNGTIKQATILRNKYKNKEEMEHDLEAFLLHYNIVRTHDSLRKELNVKTPFQAITKWYELKPQIFKLKPCEFKNKLLSLSTRTDKKHQQPCET